MCSSHLALGVSNEVLHVSTINKFSSAIAGEAKDVFTRGVLHFLSLYFVFSLLVFVCLFSKKNQKNQSSLVSFFIQKHKKNSSYSSWWSSFPCLVMLSING